VTRAAVVRVAPAALALITRVHPLWFLITAAALGAFGVA